MFYLLIVVSFFALIFTFFLIRKIQKIPAASGKMVTIANYIREEAIAYFKKQYKTAGILVIFLFFFLWIFFNFKTALGFLIGAATSILVVFVGTMVSTQANLKVAKAAETEIKEAFDLSFKEGLVSGFLVTGVGLLAVSGFYLLTQDLKTLIALGFGSSLASLFIRLNGGICAKAINVGADLISKVEKEISKDEQKNLAIITDQLGGNVGDCAGMAADLFETYVVTIIAAMVLGGLLFPNAPMAVFLPLFLASLAVLASIISTYFVKLREKQNIIFSLFRGLIIAGVLSAAGFYAIISQIASSLKLSSINLFLPAAIGLLVAGGFFLSTSFFTSKLRIRTKLSVGLAQNRSKASGFGKYFQLKSIALNSQSDHEPNIIQDLSAGIKSTMPYVILISVGLLISFFLVGIYGLAIYVVSMLSLVGLIIALNSYCLITDNASGIVEISDFPKEVISRVNALNGIGSTIKVATKSYIIVSTGLTALVLFFTFVQELVNLGAKFQFLLGDPRGLVGLFIGGIISYYFVAFFLTAVGKAASRVVEEAKKQFKETPGLLNGMVRSEYSKCVDVVTRAAFKKMIIPVILPIIFPILIGFVLGAEALGGLLIGSIIIGLFVFFLTTSDGAAWNNVKKWIKKRSFRGKKNFIHQAIVICDPYKDAVGQTISPMIKLLSITALLIIGFLV